jgi:hypothetical protein
MVGQEQWVCTMSPNTHLKDNAESPLWLANNHA